MNKSLVFEETIQIAAPIDEVWDALVNPDKIKEYLFGTNAISDWKEGSTILFKGEWKDQTYEDKGLITKIVPEEVLQYNYWSAFSGLEDKPENYSKLTMALTPTENGTTLKLTQEGFINEDSMKDSASNWEKVFETVKQMLEK